MTDVVIFFKMEIRVVIRFLSLKNYKPVKMHRKMYEAYDITIISKQAIEK